MKVRHFYFFFLTMVVASCGGIPSKIVTLIPNTGAPFQGKLTYDDGLSGTLTVVQGPSGESFSGRFTVVDRTAVQSASGSLVVPSGTIVPGVGTISSSSSGSVDAVGFWFGVGEKGSTLKCDLGMGRSGHGSGVCIHSDGSKYQIVL